MDSRRGPLYHKILVKEQRKQREEQERQEDSTCGCLSFLFKPKKKGMDKTALIQRQQQRAADMDANRRSNPVPIPGRFK